MDFNLRSILKALLFSTSDPLSIKDVQAVITRYHEQYPAVGAGAAEDPAAALAAAGLLDDVAGGEGEAGGKVDPADEPARDASGQALMEAIIEQVPTLLTAAQIREAMDAIAQELEESDDVYRLVEGTQGYRVAVNPGYAEWVRLLRDEPKPKRLSPSSMETLALIAYRQPVTRAEIEAVRGVSSDSPIHRLLERELVQVSGRADLPGRPIQYATTEKFLDFCGIKSVDELPASDVLSPNQITEWIRSATQPDVVSDADVGLPEETPVGGRVSPRLDGEDREGGDGDGDNDSAGGGDDGSGGGGDDGEGEEGGSGEPDEVGPAVESELADEAAASADAETANSPAGAEPGETPGPDPSAGAGADEASAAAGRPGRA